MIAMIVVAAFIVSANVVVVGSGLAASFWPRLEYETAPIAANEFRVGDRVLVVWMSDNSPNFEGEIIEFSTDGRYASISGYIQRPHWEHVSKLRHLEGKEIKKAVSGR